MCAAAEAAEAAVDNISVCRFVFLSSLFFPALFFCFISLHHIIIINYMYIVLCIYEPHLLTLACRNIGRPRAAIQFVP